MSLPDVLPGTYFWLGVFLISCLLFFSIAVWVIFRGGKDVWEILTEAWKKPS